MRTETRRTGALPACRLPHRNQRLGRGGRRQKESEKKESDLPNNHGNNSQEWNTCQIKGLEPEIYRGARACLGLPGFKISLCDAQRERGRVWLWKNQPWRKRHRKGGKRPSHRGDKSEPSVAYAPPSRGFYALCTNLYTGLILTKPALSLSLSPSNPMDRSVFRDFESSSSVTWLQLARGSS